MKKVQELIEKLVNWDILKEVTDEVTSYLFWKNGCFSYSLSSFSLVK